MTSHDHGAAGDLPSALDLLRYEPFVQAIARRLLSDEDQVQDLVQETWLRFFRRPPGSMASTKGWLARVVRNLASDSHRGRARRRAREAAAARPALDEAVDVSQGRLEAHHKVVEAVLALAEPYRSVVILSYYQDASPARIAERLGRKPGTVRSQLHRAHELLRADLDAEFGGDRGAWAGLLLPLVPDAARTTSAPVGLARLWGRAWGSAWGKLAVLGASLAAALVFVPLLLEAPGSGSGGEFDPGLTKVTASISAGGQDLDPELAAGQGARGSRDDRSNRTAAVRELTVVAEHEGLPVVDTDVWFLDWSTLPPAGLAALEDESLDLLTAIERFGRHAVTDERGEARFARPRDAGFALVSAPGLQGFARLEALEDGPLRVGVETVAEVAVRVVDEAGKPVSGVPVGLCATVPREDGFPDDRYVDLITRETRGPEGRVHFRGLVGGMLFSGETEPTYSLRLVVPGVPPFDTVFDHESVSTEPIVLMLAPTGSVELHTLTADGEPALLDGRATLARAGWTGPTRTVELVGGIARFALVGVGAQLEARVEVPERGIAWTAFGKGPPVEGAVARFDVLAPGRPRVAGRILDRTGAPVAEQELFLLCMLDGRSTRPRQTELRTDADGRFRAELDPEFKIGEPIRLTVLRHGIGWDARADLGHPLVVEVGESELGDLVLRDVQNVIAGRCVDEEGNPVVGLELRFLQDFNLSRRAERTDESGSFRLLGLWPEQVELSVESSEWVIPGPQLVEAGDEDVDVIVARGGVIAGSVLLDPDMSARGFEVFIMDDALLGKAVIRWSARAELDPDDGSFAAEGLLPGSYTCKLKRQNNILLEVSGIAVDLSRTTRDPRLQGIDLRGAFRTLSLRVTDEGGRAVQQPSASVHAGGKQVAWSTGTSDGVIELTFPRLGAPLISIRATGFRPLTLEGTTELTEVVLRAGISVELFTQQRPELAHEGQLAWLSLRRDDPDPRLPRLTHDAYVPNSLATGGRATVKFPGPGRYRLYVSFRSESAGGLVMSTSPTEPTGEFVLEVREEDAGGSIEVVLPDNLF